MECVLFIKILLFGCWEPPFDDFRREVFRCPLGLWWSKAPCFSRRPVIHVCRIIFGRLFIFDFIFFIDLHRFRDLVLYHSNFWLLSFNWLSCLYIFLRFRASIDFETLGKVPFVDFIQFKLIQKYVLLDIFIPVELFFEEFQRRAELLLYPFVERCQVVMH